MQHFSFLKLLYFPNRQNLKTLIYLNKIDFGSSFGNDFDSQILKTNMFKRKIKLSHLIVLAFLTPVAFNFLTSNYKTNLDCKLEINAQKTECQQQSSALASGQKILDQKQAQEILSQLETLSQKIQSPTTLQEVNQVDTNKQKYNERILEFLKNVPEDDQKKICQRNWDFVPSDQVEAQIQDICNQIKPKTTGKIQGINTNSKKLLFEIKKEDLSL